MQCGRSSTYLLITKSLGYDSTYLQHKFSNYHHRVHYIWCSSFCFLHLGGKKDFLWNLTQYKKKCCTFFGHIMPHFNPVLKVHAVIQMPGCKGNCSVDISEYFSSLFVSFKKKLGKTKPSASSQIQFTYQYQESVILNYA